MRRGLGRPRLRRYAATHRVPFPESSASLPSELNSRIAASASGPSRGSVDDFDSVRANPRVAVADRPRKLGQSAVSDAGRRQLRRLDDEEVVTNRLGFCERDFHTDKGLRG